MSSTSTNIRIVVLLMATTTLGFGPFGTDPISDGNRLFREGKFDDAKAKYGEALIDEPDSPLLNFNMGTAHYKAGNYADAIASFSRVNAGGDAKQEAAVAFNIGNAHFQLATAQEAEKPQDALKSYAEALVAYRRAVGADPSAIDAKHNYEFALKKLTELQKRLEDQKKEQQEQQQDQPQDQQQQDQQQEQQQDQQKQDEQQQDQGQPEDQQPGDQQQAEQQPQDQGEQQPEQAPQDQGEPQPEPGEQQQAGEPGEQPGEEQAQAAAAEKADQDSQAKREAAALIDMAADEELQPDEFARKVQGGVVAEPAQDW